MTVERDKSINVSGYWVAAIKQCQIKISDLANRNGTDLAGSSGEVRFSPLPSLSQWYVRESRGPMATSWVAAGPYLSGVEKESFPQVRKST
jgi:hypothetical protein